ncbi:dihydrofolate reductase family protein [Nonomuraea sp. NPDC004580]|uniref:dihydrofolate reductase family protein n=1 Tax=Nonomuraea sp. NPDC004580 TaxID=3154552 RepID=UPI0033BA6623
MRKLIFWVHTSIDGHIDGPGGAFDWPVMGEELSAYSESLCERSDTFLYGRGVWEIMVAYWPNAESLSDHPHDMKFAPVWRSTTKIVASTTIEHDDWAAEVIGTNLADRVTELKRRPGADLLLMGGAGLAGELTRLGLIDEYHIAVHPVVLGGGRPLFPRGADRLGLRFAGSRVCDAGVVVTRYDRA